MKKAIRCSDRSFCLLQLSKQDCGYGASLGNIETLTFVGFIFTFFVDTHLEWSRKTWRVIQLEIFEK